MFSSSILKNLFEKCCTQLCLFTVLFAFLFLQTASFANEGDTDPNLFTHKAPVIIDGYTLFSVRGISSHPAEDRAKAICDRIESIAKNPSIAANSIQVIHNENQEEIYALDNLIMMVFDGDAKLEGINRETFAKAIKLRITKSIYAYRYERSYEAILNKILYAVGSTILAVVLLFIVNWLMKKVNLFLEQKLKTKIEALESKSFQLIRSNQLWITLHGFIKSLKFLLILIIIFTYAQYVLGLFPWTRYISNSLLGFFLTPLGAFGDAVLNFIPNLAFLIVIFFVTKYLLKLIKLFFNGISQGLITISGFDPDWASPTYKLLRILLIAFAVIVAYPYIPGSESAAFKGVSLFIGVLFSLGSSSLIGNLIAGYTMTYRKTFKVGDLVQIDNHRGRVVEIKLFVTRLLTYKKEEIVVPNSIVLNSNVINYSSLSAKTGLILSTTVGIGYETPWRQVEGMLKLAAERTDGALKEPQPFVLQKLLGDFAVTYELNIYINDPMNRLRVNTALHQNILDVFNENNVQIMTPAYEGDPAQPKVVPKEQWFIPVAGKPENNSEKK
jgi:small-conductance mechanosensitive channel